MAVAAIARGFRQVEPGSGRRLIRRKNYLFMGSKGGGEAAAIAYTLIETCRMNSVDPEAWLVGFWPVSQITKCPISTS